MSRVAFPVILALLSVPTAVLADETRVYREGRSGATFGVSVGGGHLGCTTEDGDDCDGDGMNGAGYLALHAGFSLTPRVALMADLWGAGHTEDRLTVTQGILAAVVRVWPARSFWLQGGLGVARSSVTYDADIVEFESRSDVVPAFVAGLGVELISNRDFALDLELRGGSGMYENDMLVYTIAAGVGLSWY
jgi:hypothetical protein